MTKRLVRSAIALILIASLGTLAACAKEDTPAPTTGTSSSEPATPAEESAAPTIDPATVTELQIEDLTVGTGAEAKPGTMVTVDYTGWLSDGTQFDSSVGSGQPFQFALGQGEVIPGWDQGVAGMKVGGKRRLVIPPALGYGDQGAGGVIPPGAVLIFDVELLGVQ